MKQPHKNIMNESEIALCIEWLNLQEKNEHPNLKHHSYGYKHLVEKWADTYISNDSFIEAVKRLNIPYKWVSELNIAVALSEMTVRLYRERMKATRYGFERIPPLKRHAN
jgi:hypothetical protein